MPPLARFSEEAGISAVAQVHARCVISCRCSVFKASFDANTSRRSSMQISRRLSMQLSRRLSVQIFRVVLRCKYPVPCFSIQVECKYGVFLFATISILSVLSKVRVRSISLCALRNLWSISYMHRSPRTFFSKRRRLGVVTSQRYSALVACFPIAGQVPN